MSWFFKLLGAISGNTAEVDSKNQVLVRPTQDLTSTPATSMGFVGLAGLNDSGAFVASGRAKAAWVTESNRLTTAQTTYYWDDTFNATAQNTSKYRAPTTTQTVTQSGGYLILNSSGITTANTNSAQQTYRNFLLIGNAETRLIVSAMFASATTHVANNTTEFGLFSAALPGGAAPTDGVFFRYNTANELRGVINYNGTETQTAAITKPADNVAHDYMIVITTDVVTFWIDRQLRGVITLVTDAPAQGQPFMAASQPITIRQYIGGSAPASATKLQVSDVFLVAVGPSQNRSWAEQKAGFGHMAYQGQNGGTMGTTAQLANSTNPAAAVPTNTTAALGSGLGGLFWETDTLAVSTDGIIQSFQNPVGSATQTPRNLIIRGVGIASSVQTALTAGGYVAQWSLAFGHTAVSLATAEGATAKAPRRIALPYTQAVASAQAINTKVGADFFMALSSPVVIAPGEFIALVKRKIGTAPTAGVIAHCIVFDAYFE